MSRLAPRFRAAVVLAAATFALHQLRYAIGYGSHGEQELAAQGHAYLGVLGPAIVGALAVCAAQFLHALSGPRQAPGVRRWGPAWLAASVALLAVYAGQELIEGLLATGHPGGLAGVFGHGGLVAIPLALAGGALVACAAREARHALSRGAGARPLLPRLELIGSAVCASGAAAPRAAALRRRPARGPPRAVVVSMS